MTESSGANDLEANEADVQEQQKTVEGTVPNNAGPDLDRLEQDLGEAGEADVAEQSQS